MDRSLGRSDVRTRLSRTACGVPWQTTLLVACCVLLYLPCGARSACSIGKAGIPCTSCVNGQYCHIDSGDYYCELCSAGHWGAGGSETDPTCCGMCDAGYYCEQGSPSKTQHQCGTGNWCAAGSETPNPCSPGRYTQTATSVAVSDCLKCPAGNFCGVDAIKQACPPGRWSDGVGVSGNGDTSCSPCDAGRYAWASGSTSSQCYGPCSAGYYCPLASTTNEQEACGGGYYCPSGTASRIECPAGRYSAAAHNEAENDCTLAGLGHYAPGGGTTRTKCPVGRYSDIQDAAGWINCKACPAGTVGDATGLQSSSCNRPCPAGYRCQAFTTAVSVTCGLGASVPKSRYCPEGTGETALIAPAGKYTVPENSAADRRENVLPCTDGYYCPGNGLRTPCPAGYYGEAGGMHTSSTCAGICPAGKWCASASVGPTPCAAGTASSQQGRTSACTASCQAGYFCPAGSSSTTQFQCATTKNSHYCPAGAGSPTPVTSGYYATGGSSDFTRTSEAICQGGYYCASGTMTICPAGRYGSGISSTRTTDQCDGPCTAGYFCAAGSTSATQSACGTSSTAFEVFCPTATSQRNSVSPGFYTLPTSNTDGLHRTSQTKCTAGYYCTGGLRAACPAGKYGATDGLDTDDCSGDCDPGHYCLTASTSATSATCPAGRYGSGGSTTNVCDGECRAGYYCPEASDREDFAICPAGTGCPAGQGDPLPCAAGRWSSEPGLTVAECPNSCSAGYYCPEGAPQQIACGGSDKYCPAPASSPTPVSVGYYSTGGLPDGTTRTGQEPCAVAHYCIGGVQTPCPSGRFGNVGELHDEECSGPCTAGYFCSDGSQSPTAQACAPEDSETAANFYCPEGTPSQLIVSQGSYSLPEDLGDLTHRVSTAVCGQGFYCSSGLRYPCPAGRVGDETGLVSNQCARACPAGHWCPEQTVVPTGCDAGRYNSQEGRGEACSDLCDEGYYCVGASPSATQHECGGPDVYCPAGSSDTTAVPEGYMSVGGTASTRSGIEICPRGSYCIAGVRELCPAGRYGASEAMTDPLCSGPCGNSTVYCLEGSTWPSSVQVGFYSLGNGADDTQRTAEKECPMGHYCVEGVLIACDGGSWSSDVRRTEPCEDCPAGYFCAPASTSATDAPCGGSRFFCPEKSSSPSVVTLGWYSTGGSGPTTRTGQAPCEAPYFCDATGVRQLCPAGTFGTEPELTSNDCSGQCSSGWFCDAGSLNSTAAVCGGPGLYCPSGTPSRLPVDVGYYSTPEGADAVHRSGQEPCPAGSFCDGGVRHLCAAGKYSSALARAQPCSANCTAGYACPAGSTSPVQVPCDTLGSFCRTGTGEAAAVAAGYYGVLDATGSVYVDELPCAPGSFCSSALRSPCPAGRYGDAPLLNSSVCSGTCNAGYWCDAGSISPTQERCGGAHVYCPAGTERPVVVEPGWYSAPVSVSEDVRYESESCPKGSFCLGGRQAPCPAGKYGNAIHLSEPSCSGDCQAGFYCPAGSLSDTVQSCGNHTVYCPASTKAPLRVEDGFLGNTSSAAALLGSARGFQPVEVQSEQVPCVPGSWCKDGISSYCPPGRFGCSGYLSEEGCSGPCAAGHYCEEGAISAQEHRCGNETVYCPTGSSAPVVVDVGYFSNEDGPADRRSSQEICPRGSWCFDGTRTLCSAGRYGDSEGLSTADCSGQCRDGIICDAGTTTADGVVCPAGSWCERGFRFPCPMGTFSNVTGLTEESQCVHCPPFTFQPNSGADSIAACEACVEPESSNAGAAACWPALVSAVAFDPPPVDAGLSDGDTITFTFTSPTNTPVLRTTADVLRLLRGSSSFGAELEAVWSTDTKLVVTIVNATGATTAEDTEQLRFIGALHFWIMADGDLRDFGGLSQPSRTADHGAILLGGNWGTPTPPRIVSAHALGPGKQVGLGEGDKLVLTFDQKPGGPLSTGVIEPTMVVAQLLQFSTFVGDALSAEWTDDVTLVVSFLAGSYVDVSQDEAAIGVLQVSISERGHLISADGLSEASNSTAFVTTGTWGDIPSDCQTRVRSATSLEIAANAPLGDIGYLPQAYLFSWMQTNGSLPSSEDSGWQTVEVLSDGKSKVHTTIAGLVADVPVFVRIAADNLGAWGPWTSPRLDPTTPRRAHVTSVAVAGDQLDTPGGGQIRLFGQWLGLPRAIEPPLDYVRVSLVSSSELIPAHDCTIVSPREVTCTAPSGAGAHLPLQIWVDGTQGSTADGVHVSYARPTVSDVVGARMANTQGGVVVAIHGANFGASLDYLDAVEYWSTSVLGEPRVFRAENCALTHPHRVLECNLAPGGGANLLWQVTVAGQRSRAPLTRYEAPVVAAIAPAHASVNLQSLNTEGNDPVFLVGQQFGPAMRDNVVQARLVSPSLGLEYAATNCSVVSGHERILCFTPPGVGDGYSWQVNVGGQWSAPSSHVTAFEAPRILNVEPAVLETTGGVDVVLTGELLGDDASQIELSVNEEITSFTILESHRQLAFRAPVSAGEDVEIRIVVAGQPTRPAVFTIPVRAPVISALDLPEDGDESTIILLGSSFGVGPPLTAVRLLNNETCAPPAACYCDIVSRSHLRIRCVPPAVEGTLTVHTVGKASNNFAFSYDALRTAPAIVSVSLPGGAPTTGGTRIVIRGSDLIRTSGAVYIAQYRTGDTSIGEPQLVAVGDTVECAVLESSGTEVVAVLPEGRGRAWRITVATRGLVSRPSAVQVSYDAPIISHISPGALPTGGGMLLIEGNNLGKDSDDGSVTVQGLDCVPHGVWNHTHIQCLAPAGGTPSAAVVVSVSQVDVAQPGTIEYLAPVVDFIFPDTCSSAGGVPVTIYGSNLAVPGAVALPYVTVGITSCGLIEPYNETLIRCVAPVGSTARAVVHVSNGERESLQEDVRLSYDPPLVTGVYTSAGRPVSGGFEVEVTGTSLGATPRVRIGGEECVLVDGSLSANHSSLVCVAPPRPEVLGREVPLLVSWATLSSQPLPFSYDAPAIDRVVPNVLDAREGGAIRLYGRNFGNVWDRDGLFVSLGSDSTGNDTRQCNDLVWLGDSELSCSVGGDLRVSSRSLSVSAFTMVSESVTLRAVCSARYYGKDGEYCQPCPLGATCAGGEADPIAAAGFYRKRRDVFVGCRPLEACIGGEDIPCANGYEEFACASCASGYYRLEQRCHECPEMAWMLLAGFGTGALFLGGLIAILARRRVELTALSIGIDFLQAVSLFGAFSFRWPPMLLDVLGLLSFSSLNMEVVAPECTLTWGFRGKWYAVQLSIIILVAVCGLMWFVGKCVSCWFGSGTRATQRGKGLQQAASSALLQGLYLMYFVVVRSALLLFDCTTDADGVSTMDADPSILCGDNAGGIFAELYPLAMASLVLYGAGIPLFFSAVLWFNRDSIRKDQLLRAQGKGRSEAANPYWETRVRWGRLYGEFKPGMAWWRMVLLARKLLVATTAILFNSNAVFQASVCVAVLFAAFVAHSRYQPWIVAARVSEAFLASATSKRQGMAASTSPADGLVAAITRSSPETSPEGSPDSSPRARLAANKGRGSARARRRSTLVVASEAAVSAVVSRALNYNSLERALLLTSATVLLSGLLFESADFAAGTLSYFVLSIGVTTAVVGACVALFCIFVFEVVRGIRYGKLYKRADSFEKQMAKSGGDRRARVLQQAANHVSRSERASRMGRRAGSGHNGGSGGRQPDSGLIARSAEVREPRASTRAPPLATPPRRSPPRRSVRPSTRGGASGLVAAGVVDASRWRGTRPSVRGSARGAGRRSTVRPQHRPSPVRR